MFNCSYWLIISPPCWRGHAKPRPHTAIRCALSALLLPPGRIPWQFLCLGTSLCMCLCVCMCLLYLPIHNVRNCNFSFHCCGIIKWQEYLMQLYAKWVCVCVCVFNSILWLPTWHAQLLTVDALHSQQPNVHIPIMESRLWLPRLKKLGGHRNATWHRLGLKIKHTVRALSHTHARTFTVYSNNVRLIEGGLVAA